MKTIPPYSRLHQFLWPSAHQPRSNDWALVQRIRETAATFEELGDKQLADYTGQLRLRIQSGIPTLTTQLVIDCFALTFVAVSRITGLQYYDVQLLAGLALAAGTVAEMKTGEGKTIVAALPASLRALCGRGVHVATVNSYLAQRDFELLKPAYEMLGFSVGLLNEEDTAFKKRDAYLADITYGTGYEFGFDYLRDQAAMREIRKPGLGEKFRNQLRGEAFAVDRTVQRGHAFAVIDEVDSVLIDEANTPLVLSSNPKDVDPDPAPHLRAAEVASKFVENEHYIIDRRRRTISLTETGFALIFQSQNAVPIEGLARPWQTYIEHALRARHILELDTDYVIQDGKVRIVDQYTGRIFSDRTWRDGLHQAVEVKEKVPLTHEKISVGRVSRQRYFGLYDALCGMTGTATGHEREFQEFYGLAIVVIPERVPNQRSILPTRYFGAEDAKRRAIVDDICQRYRTGQPVLVGTRTIDESAALAALLEEARIPHQVLNGLQSEDEAKIISRAGQRACITIATNMAGRGTDIRVDRQVAALGGLHVIATQRQESRRVDRQLVGRAARQGSPGSCQFFVSADDELVAQFQPTLAARMRSVAADDGEVRRDFSKDIDQAQRTAEQQRYTQRSDLFRQDEWLNDVLTTVAANDVTTPSAIETPEYSGGG